jgi:hypothetical protein
MRTILAIAAVLSLAVTAAQAQHYLCRAVSQKLSVFAAKGWRQVMRVTSAGKV